MNNLAVVRRKQAGFGRILFRGPHPNPSLRLDSMWQFARNGVSSGSQAMKPAAPSDSINARFPRTDWFLRSGIENWRGYASPYEGDDRRALRNFHSLHREFLIEAGRERAKEMAVFAIVMLVAAWPVVYMIISVVKLLAKGRPLE